MKHTRVLFLGGESSGKSTITKAMADLTNSYYAHEYGRQFYEERPDKAYEYNDLDVIAKAQAQLELDIIEKSVLENKQFSFYDTSFIVTYFYSMQWFGKACSRLKTAGTFLWTYQHIFLCENDFPFVQDGSRQSEQFSKKQYEFYKLVLERHGLKYHL